MPLAAGVVAVSMAQAMQSAEAGKPITTEGAGIAPAFAPEELRVKFECEFVEREQLVRGAKILP